MVEIHIRSNGRYRRSQSIGSQLDLMRTLLSAHIEHFFFWDIENSLQRERTLTDTRFATQQSDTALHHSTTEYTVQFLIVHINTGFIVGRDITKLHGLGCSVRSTHAAKHSSSATMSHRHARISGSLGSRISGDSDFLESIPLSTTRTFANPLG